MSIELPLTVGSALTLVGAAAFAAVVGQWLKKYLNDWRYTGLIVLGLSLAFTGVAQCIASDWRPDGTALFNAFLLGLGGATLAVFGYEQVANLLGLVGIGPRSNRAIVEQARRQVEAQAALSKMAVRR